MGRNSRSASACLAWVSWTLKSFWESVVKVALPTTFRPSLSASAMNLSLMPVE